MGGEFTYQPKWAPKTVFATTADWAQSPLTSPKLSSPEAHGVGPRGAADGAWVKWAGGGGWGRWRPGGGGFWRRPVRPKGKPTGKKRGGSHVKNVEKPVFGNIRKSLWPGFCQRKGPKMTTRCPGPLFAEHIGMSLMRTPFWDHVEGIRKGFETNQTPPPCM